MRLIGELDDKQNAQTFAAYLLTQGISSQLEEENGKVEIWVREEDRFGDAVEELRKFEAAPGDSKYAASVHEAKAIAKEAAKKRQQLQKKIVKVGAQPGRRSRTTITLIVLSVIVSLLTQFGEQGRVKPDDPTYRALKFNFVSLDVADKMLGDQAVNSDSLQLRTLSLQRGEVWRLFTPMLIHFGVFHILFNMYWLFTLGVPIENRYGSMALLGIVMLVAGLSNFAQGVAPIGIGGSGTYTYGESLITSFGGMSGVVFGLFGFVWMKSVYDRSSGFRVSDTMVIILVGYLFFCMIPREIIFNATGLRLPEIANWAHGIGMLSGMAIGYLTSLTKR